MGHDGMDMGTDMRTNVGINSHMDRYVARHGEARGDRHGGRTCRWAWGRKWGRTWKSTGAHLPRCVVMWVVLLGLLASGGARLCTHGFAWMSTGILISCCSCSIHCMKNRLSPNRLHTCQRNICRVAPYLIKILESEQSTRPKYFESLMNASELSK